jgi:secondary thiamine-phosphate synthase enzyme
VELTVKTKQDRQVIDITDDVQKAVQPGAKAVIVYAMHTTCGVTTAEVEPELDQDLLDFLGAIRPKGINWRHAHDPSQSPWHSLSAIIGSNINVPVQDGKLILGTWQRIVLLELDGPRERKVTITNL